MKRRTTSILAPPRRRSFLKTVAGLLCVPAVPLIARYRILDELTGTAHAEDLLAQEPTYFVELNLRDQFDFMHAFVPPGIATYDGLRRGDRGNRCVLFHDASALTQHRGNVFLTPDSQALVPHLDQIAVMELNEVCNGEIHGHEAAGPVRSPGRQKTQTAGKAAMWTSEPGYQFQGNDHHYSSTPTPASLHNRLQKELTPGVRNGVAMKFISRNHHVCHFGAGDARAELDRIQTRDTLFQRFPDTVQDLNALGSAEEAALLTRAIRRVDDDFFDRYGLSQAARTHHEATLDEAVGRLYSADNNKVVSLPLTPEEVEYWSTGVPDQVGSAIKAQIWEALAWTEKLLTHGLTRSVAIDWDYLDVHDTRGPEVLSTMAQQFAIPLARLIQRLKDAGIYEQTVIAVFSADGGRAPAANSYGNTGKNSLVLCGKNVRGGYYGDVGVAGPDGDGHRYDYHVPDPQTGVLRPPVTNNDRLEGAYAWRTVMKALGTPDSTLEAYPDVAGFHALDFMLTS